MSRPRFSLYLCGAALPRNRQARKRLETLLESLYPEGVELRVVDIQSDPEAAESAGILAAPTLIRHWPEPGLRIIGDFSDADGVRNLLE